MHQLGHFLVPSQFLLIQYSRIILPVSTVPYILQILKPSQNSENLCISVCKRWLCSYENEQKTAENIWYSVIVFKLVAEDGRTDTDAIFI